MKIVRPNLTQIYEAPIGSQVYTWLNYKERPDDFEVFTKYSSDRFGWAYKSNLSKAFPQSFPPLRAFHRIELVTND